MYKYNIENNNKVCCNKKEQYAVKDSFFLDLHNVESVF